MASTIVRFAIAAMFGATAGIALAQPVQKERVILLVGPPGSGKTTQAKFLSKKYAVPAFSMSDLLKKKLPANSPLGKALAVSIASGETLPDEAAADLVKQHLASATIRKGFILDGFPSTAAQAKALDIILQDQHLPKAIVVVLDVPDDVLRKRMLARRRVDDTPDVIDRRIKDFRNEAALLADWVGKTSVVRVNADEDIPVVSSKIVVGIETALTNTNTLKVREAKDNTLKTRE